MKCTIIFAIYFLCLVNYQYKQIRNKEAFKKEIFYCCRASWTILPFPHICYRHLCQVIYTDACVCTQPSNSETQKVLFLPTVCPPIEESGEKLIHIHFTFYSSAILYSQILQAFTTLILSNHNFKIWRTL